MALLLVPLGLTAATGLPRRSATTSLIGHLRAAGRAEVRIERRAPDPLSGSDRVAAGVLSLEMPDCARIDFDRAGESLTLRADGGEWLQPALSQLVRLPSQSARAGLRWWSVMLGDSSARFHERALGPGRFVIVLPAAAEAPADTAWVTIGAEGLPDRLEILEEEGRRTIYRLRNWRFSRPKGRAAFVLEPPPGCETVDMR